MDDFQITACHANRAGHASVSLRHTSSGAMVMIHHVPFEHDYGETVRDECRRVQMSAATIGRKAIEFLLSACPAGSDIKGEAAPGAAPNADVPPNAFGQETGAE